MRMSQEPPPISDLDYEDAIYRKKRLGEQSIRVRALALLLLLASQVVVLPVYMFIASILMALLPLVDSLSSRVLDFDRLCFANYNISTRNTIWRATYYSTILVTSGLLVLLKSDQQLATYPLVTTVTIGILLSGLSSITGYLLADNTMNFKMSKQKRTHFWDPILGYTAILTSAAIGYTIARIITKTTTDPTGQIIPMSSLGYAASLTIILLLLLSITRTYQILETKIKTEKQAWLTKKPILPLSLRLSN